MSGLPLFSLFGYAAAGQHDIEPRRYLVPNAGIETEYQNQSPNTIESAMLLRYGAT